jgi:predicted metal-binding membrane protein
VRTLAQRAAVCMSGVLERVLRYERLLVVASLAVAVALAWAYLVEMAEHVGMGHLMMSPIDRPWGAAEFWGTLLMWVVMMVGMMLPSAAPLLLLFLRAERNAVAKSVPLRVLALATGYLAAWSLFSVGATALQWALSEHALLAIDLTVNGPLLGGTLFIAAGVYEWSSIKHRCLDHCQSPLGYLMRHHRPGVLGALRMGIGHGLYCVGCCAVLMLLLFAGGIMNLVWIALLAALALAQKVWRHGALLSRAAGAFFLAAGALLVVQAI